MDNQEVSFKLGGMDFEYNEGKDRTNMKNHGIPFKYAARVFFDYDRIEEYDKEHSEEEDRFNTIGSAAVGSLSVIGTTGFTPRGVPDIIFVTYTVRGSPGPEGADVTRLISARFATDFERGLYYGKYT